MQVGQLKRGFVGAAAMLEWSATAPLYNQITLWSPPAPSNLYPATSILYPPLSQRTSRCRRMEVSSGSPLIFDSSGSTTKNLYVTSACKTGYGGGV